MMAVAMASAKDSVFLSMLLCSSLEAWASASPGVGVAVGVAVAGSALLVRVLPGVYNTHSLLKDDAK